MNQSKRAIFALQRDNVSEAAEKLTLAKKIFTDLEKTFHKEAALLDEGSYLAALEEYVEAALLHQFLTTGKIGEVKGMAVAVNVYIAGLCDLPGELYRYAIKAATKHEIEMVKKCARLSDDIIGELIAISGSIAAHFHQGTLIGESVAFQFITELVAKFL